MYSDVDHLGSVRRVSTGAGALEKAYDFFPYGLPVKETVGQERLWFGGYELEHQNTPDYTDDLYFLHARWYFPSMARFLSPDPVRGDPAQPQSLNLYAYVRGNPLNAVDPDGRITLAQYHVLQALKDAAFAASSQERFFEPLGRALWEGAKVLLAALQEALADMQRPGAGGGDDEGSGVDHAASAVGQLREAQDQAMTNPGFQQVPPERGPTHCNQATVFVARAVGAPLDPLVDRQGYALPANQMAANLAASPQYRAVSEAEAQALANQGRFVIAAWNNPKGAHGHVATVRPEIQGDRLLKPGGTGALLANVGPSRLTGVPRRNWAFPRGADVRYYTPVE